MTARIDDIKAEWARICYGVLCGTYHGTEADAMARIDAIKAEIAELEKAA
jgi:hypothetical protein